MKKIIISKVCIFATIAASLSGCGMSLFASRDTNPAIQDISVAPHWWPWNRTNVNTFATTASRRLVIAKHDNDGDVLTTCAEPPPDVGEAFASAVASGLQAAGTVTHPTGEKITAELATQYGRAVATQIAPLLYRTQGLQLYRDSTYKLCIDRMNGWITQKAYDDERREMLNQAVSLIQTELPLMQESVSAFYAAVKAGEAKVNVGDIVKILEAQKSEKSTEK
jgi:hypothetical protein